MSAEIRAAKYISALVIACLSLSLLRAEPQKTRAKKGNPAPAPVDLVWPGPPAAPRIRFLESMTGIEDAGARTKLSFVERLSGRSLARDQLRLKKPYGVAVDRAGRVYVADAEQRAIVVFARNPRSALLWKGNAQFPLFVPIGLAFSEDGRLFVSDSFGGQIVVFGPDGRPVACFGKANLGRPGGIVVDDVRKRLYVADAKLNQVLAFNTGDYQFQRAIGRPAKPNDLATGALSGPTNLALNAKGELLVTDTLNCRVQVFDPDGKFLRSFGSQGDRPGRFIRPKGIALDSENHIYVVDAAFSNFQVFAADGKPLLFVGSGGNQPGQFQLPAGMTIDHEDRIYVTEQRVDGGRLQIFQYLKQTPAKP